MARLGGDNNVADSLVVLSSDEEGEDDSAKSKKDPNGTSIPPDFMCLVRTLRKYLEEKDERRCNILGLMYKKASSTLKSSKNFKSFIKDIMAEIEKGKTDRAHVLILLTAVCQTLAVGEIMWSPASNPAERSKSNKQPNKSRMEPETRKQCNAVKALLFNDSPPPVPKDRIENKAGENSEAAKDKEKVVRKSGRVAKQSFSNNNDKSKNKPTSKGATAGTDAKGKSKSGENSENTKDKEKVEKKSGRGARQSFSGNNVDKTKAKQAVKESQIDSTDVASKANDKKSMKSSKRNTNSDNNQNEIDLVSSSPEHEPDPFITDLSTEASNLYPAVLPSPKIAASPKIVDFPPTEMSNVIELDDFDVSCIVTEEVASENDIGPGESSITSSPKPDLEKNSSSCSSPMIDVGKNDTSVLDINIDDIDLTPKGRSTSKLLLNTIPNKCKPSTNSPVPASCEMNVRRKFQENNNGSPKEKPTTESSSKKPVLEKRSNLSVDNSVKKGKLAPKGTVQPKKSITPVVNKLSEKLKSPAETKVVEKTPESKQTKKSGKSASSESDHDENSLKTTKVKQSPLNSPILSPYSRRSTFLEAKEILSPYSRRSTFLKAIEKVKENSKADRRPETVEVYAPPDKPKEKKNSDNSEATDSSGKKKKRGKSSKGSKTTSPDDSSDDEVLFVSERPADMPLTPAPPLPLQTKVLLAKELPMPNLVDRRTVPRPDMPWNDAQAKKSPATSLLDMCYVYEITASGQKVPSPLVNNKNMQPTAQSSVLSTRETSQHLSGTECISVVTPSKTYTTTVNSKSPVEMTASKGSPAKINRFNNPTEYTIGKDGKALESNVEKRQYTSENYNPGMQVSKSPGQYTGIKHPNSSLPNKTQMKKMQMKKRAASSTPTSARKKNTDANVPGGNVPAYVTSKSLLNNRAQLAGHTAHRIKTKQNWDPNKPGGYIVLSTGNSPSLNAAKKGLKQVYRRPVKLQRLKQKNSTDVTVVLDSSSEGSGNEEDPKDAPQKQKEDSESIANVERNEKELSTSSGDDFMPHEKSKGGKDTTSPSPVNKIQANMPEIVENVTDEKKRNETSSESSGDDVMEITNPERTVGGDVNDNNQVESSTIENCQNQDLSDESPSVVNEDCKEPTSENIGDDELAVLPDPGASPQDDECEESEMNDERETFDKPADTLNNENEESTCVSSEDDVAEVPDPNGPGDESESNEVKSISSETNEDEEAVSDKSPGDSSKVNVLSAGESSSDEVTEVSDPNAKEDNELTDNKSFDMANNGKAESKHEVSGVEPLEETDENDPDEVVKDKTSGLTNDGKAECTPEVSGEATPEETDGNDLDEVIEETNEVEKIEYDASEKDVGSNVKCPPESSSEKVKDSEKKDKTEKVVSAASSESYEDSVKILDDDKECEETSTSRIEESKKTPSMTDSNKGVTKSPADTTHSLETPKSSKQNGKKSIQDIANSLKKKVQEKEDDEIKIIEPPSNPVPSSSQYNRSSSQYNLQKEAIGLYSTARPSTSSISSQLNSTVPSNKGSSPLNSIIPSSQSKAPSSLNSMSSDKSGTEAKDTTTIILIGDDSDDENDVSNVNSVEKAPPTKPSSLSRTNPSVAISRASVEKPTPKKASVTSKTSSSSKTNSAPPRSKPVLIKRPTTAKKAVVKTISTTPKYVSSILSKKTSDTDEAPSSSILSKGSYEGDKTVDKSTPSSSNEKEPVKLTSKKAKIRQLEILLERLERRINKYSRQELSFKDMASEESIYMQEARAKERYLYNWKLYCKLTGDDPDLVVSARKKIKVTSSPFSQLNSAVMKYVNRSDIFPNLFEVKQVCAQANLKYNLELKDNDLHHCAVDIFSEVGRKLQKRREKEFRTTSGNVVTDEVSIENDPARNDQTLRKKLKQNKKIARQRTENVFKDFVRQQYEQTTGAIDGSDGSDSESTLNDSVIRRDISDSDSDNQDGNSDSDTREKTSDHEVQDQNSDSDVVAKNSDSDTQDNDSDSDSQDKNSDYDEDSDTNLTLEQLRKKKRKPVGKSGGKQVVKKKRVDKTVISLTLSSSQEIAADTGNKKIDYQVTIGSSSPKVKTLPSKSSSENRTKSPINSQITPKPTQKLSLLQPKSKYKGSKPTMNNEKTLELSNSAKRKRISMTDKNDSRVLSSVTSEVKAPGNDNKKPKIGSSINRPFTGNKKKVLPSFVTEKAVIGTGETKNTDVPAKFIPLSSIRKASDSVPKVKGGPSLVKVNSSKSLSNTIVLDDDDD